MHKGRDIEEMMSEYTEYIEEVAGNTAEMVAAIDAMKNELLNTLGEEYHGSIIQIARETQEVLIQDAYRMGMVPFMQPAAEAPEDANEEEPETQNTNREERRGRR